MRLLQGTELHDFCQHYVASHLPPGQTELDVRIGTDAWIERFPQSARRNMQLVDPLDDLFFTLPLGEAPVGIPPGGFVLVATEEHFSLPPSVMGLFTLRSFAAKRGMGQAASLVLKPGWTGNLIMELANQLRHHELLIKRGDAVGQVQFFYVGGSNG